MADDSTPDVLAGYDLVLVVSDFLRLTADDPTVEVLVSAAVSYLEKAGVVPPTDESKMPLYELAVCLYVQIIYSGGESKLEPSMTGIMHQLRA